MGRGQEQDGRVLGTAALDRCPAMDSRSASHAPKPLNNNRSAYEDVIAKLRALPLLNITSVI